MLLLVGLSIPSSVGYGTNAKLAEILQRVLTGEITFSSLIDPDISTSGGYKIDPKIAQTIAEAKSLLQKIDDIVQNPSIPQSVKVRELSNPKVPCSHFVK